ncbi:RluA family pseudouridine synthase [Acinetobacter ursingii]|uniref:RluA family pseudouridine synthase n=1 Tax=Acinetobacter ursingii TaxID=108980 RepID=A0A3G9G2F0_9GAMM|nr:RluA family pseudouridine synthase [Acinetobacter ursingii]MCH2014839.1 RluA family pseudouridine synthase [Acinetobacter ursingii]MCU4495202.1 RluA family pseudouridine synthase [Acinetobacter ursingii]MDA3579312.1 RluA family pseudouridine synthase [Acinetobacter ursingii]MDH0808988.1 RluA family pseudouridine synthase [Acinetobacter ursingii]MDH2019961.1 RluA family pseudouridine synthase [Acinetobacter ursingii]
MNKIEFKPPMINGVSASQVFLPHDRDQTIQTVFQYLYKHFAHILEQEWRQRFTEGLIYDSTGQILSVDSPYQASTHIFYYRFLAHEIHVPFEHQILFENEHLLIVDKPHFLTISPTGQYVQETLLVRLKNQTGIEELSPIHRLDRETAGIVLFSKKAEVRHAYQELFAKRQVQKTYHAIAAYDPELYFPQTLNLCMEKGQPFYTMQINPCGEPNSETLIECLEHNKTWAKYQLKPHTGKQHQLRVHLNYLGIPIKNDPFYPTVQHKADDDFSAPLQLLAKSIEFTDPINSQKICIESTFDLSLSYQSNDK